MIVPGDAPQESDQSDNFDRRSKFYEIPTTTYVEDKQCTEILAT